MPFCFVSLFFLPPWSCLCGWPLTSLLKLSPFFCSVHQPGAHSPESDTLPLLNKTNSEHMFETMTMELEQLMTKLTEVNDRLAEYTQNFSLNSPSATLLHTLQRHRDILQNYSHEFQKTKANITALKERDDLLGSVHRDINAYKNSSGLNRRTDLYLKEHEHLRNSERLVDEQISVAMATKENLHLQKNFLNNITQTMNSFANRFPIVNSLIQRANIRKRRDSIVLAAVIATCTILMILYAFH